MKFTAPALLAFTALPLVCAESAKVKVFHRVFHPLLPQQSYVERGAITVASDARPSLESAPSLSEDFAAFSSVLDTIPSSSKDALYQIALQREGDTSEGQWDVSSVKVCHLPQATSQYMVLHVVDGQSLTPFALDYFFSPIPHDGSCPKASKSKSKSLPAGKLSPFQAFSENVSRLNTTIVLREPVVPPLPELRTPPPLTPEGEVVQPIPEKSFLQKYWMYMVAVVIALLFSGGAEEEQPRRGGQ